MNVNERQRWQDLGISVGKVFTPNTPIDARTLFAGREMQIRRIVDVVNQTGQHGILFGERGVGKTSLANVLSELVPGWGGESKVILSPRINCDHGDTFGTIWQKVFDQIQLTKETSRVGFGDDTTASTSTALEMVGAGVGADITPDLVRRALTFLANATIPILIIDEFDRIEQQPRRGFADLIKSLSDHAVPATVLLVGVADSVTDLIQEHESVARALVQIPMPRMNPREVREIVTKGLNVLGMTITPRALERVVLLSQGLPHYTHLVALHAARASIDMQSMTIDDECVRGAIEQSIDDAQHSIKIAYYDAVRSARKDSLFEDVLLACALAPANELGFFSATDVRGPIRKITGRSLDIPSFARHLKEFSGEKRGTILQKAGEKHRHRYRFADPLMQPFVIMQGMARGSLPKDAQTGPEGGDSQEIELELGLFRPAP